MKALGDTYEMTTVTFEDGTSITGRVLALPHDGYIIQHVVKGMRHMTLFCDFVDME